uniref:Uncharacterized protein n=1 Tax=Cucumis sativus TaxID=3659 RepID=A0A0A0KYM9_CUCSA
MKFISWNVRETKLSVIDTYLVKSILRPSNISRTSLDSFGTSGAFLFYGVSLTLSKGTYQISIHAFISGGFYFWLTTVNGPYKVIFVMISSESSEWLV